MENISVIVGFAYTILWSLSFYPQAILNYKRKSVSGLSLDFVYLNTLGFICYFIYNICFYFDSHSIDQYLDRYHENPSIHINDLIFSGHALLLSLIVLVQCQIYPSQTRKTVLLSKLYFSIVLLGLFITTVMVHLKLLLFIDLLYFLSLVKIGVTLLKYFPQMILNYRNKSTIGWSIENIVLDLGGGILSIIQMLIDSSILGNWTPIFGNPVKFGLGISSIVFDGVFIAQHHFLGYDTEEIVKLGSDERAPLLPMSLSSESFSSNP